MRLLATAALLLASFAVACPAAAAPPGHCRGVGAGARPHGGGPVLIAATSTRDAVEIDGAPAPGGALLVVGLSLGKHRVIIQPESGTPRVHAFELGADRRARVIPKGASLARTRPFHLSLARAVTLREIGDEAPVVAKRPRLSVRPIRADELASFHCDPRLAPHLPPVAQLLAETEAACDRDDRRACETAAEQWFEDVGFRPRDPAQAVRRLEHACRLEADDACALLARMLEIGNGTAKDPARAAKVLEAACLRGHARSCAERAWTVLGSSPTTPDRARAAPLMKRACELDAGFCGPAREIQLRLACALEDRGACELLLPDDAVRRAIEARDTAADR